METNPLMTMTVLGLPAHDHALDLIRAYPTSAPRHAGQLLNDDR